MQNVPQSVLRQLSETAKISSDSHPDADLLTAFVEHTLASRERAFVMEHLATCGDCRDVVALAIPPEEMISPGFDVRKAGWFTWPTLRWAALAAGILAVASVGVLQYDRRQPEKLVASNTMKPEAAAVSPLSIQTNSAQIPSDEQQPESQRKAAPPTKTRSLSAPRPAQPSSASNPAGLVGFGHTSAEPSGFAPGSPATAKNSAPEDPSTGSG